VFPPQTEEATGDERMRSHGRELFVTVDLYSVVDDEPIDAERDNNWGCIRYNLDFLVILSRFREKHISA